MKTKPILLLAWLAATAGVFAQPAATAPAEPRTGEPNRRSPAANAPNPRDARGDQGPQGNPGNAGNPPNQPQPHRPDAFMDSFFQPEAIMHHQRVLNLSEDQRKRLIETIQKAQPQFTELQWQLEAEQATLSSLMRAERADEKQILAQLDKVMRLEADMKRGQLAMLVRLKNELTPEQQMKLREATRPRRPIMPGQPGQGPAMQQPRQDGPR
jgi:Spy/CpxP family protein refolding chaperone